MRKIWRWTQDNAGPITVTLAVLGGFAAIIQFSVVRPMQQGFTAVNQRIDDQIRYIDQRFDAQDRSINQRFDAVNQRFDDQDRSINQRFDAQDRRIEDLVRDVSELRKLNDRVIRNETRIDILIEQLQTADAPSP